MKNNDVPKVRSAMIVPVQEGSQLVMHTLEGVKVTFLLDDLAMATLALMVDHALEAALGRTKEDPMNAIVFGKDAASE